MSLRARIFGYLAAVHVLPAVVAGLLLVDRPWWLLAVEVAFVVSLATGAWLARQLLSATALSDDATRLLGEQELTTRLLTVGDERVDALVRVYNRMVDALRDHRVRLQEQHHFLAEILRSSPSGIVVLDFDGRITEVNPAAERLLGLESGALTGHDLGSVAGPVVRGMEALAPGASTVVTLAGPRRVRLYAGRFYDRGFSRQFFLIEELTDELRQVERAAYEKLVRVMSHEVNNTVAASTSLLHSAMTYAPELSPENRADFERAIGIVIGRTEQLNQFLRRFADIFRLPPPAREPHDLREIVASLVTLVSARPDARGIRWTHRLEGDHVVVDVDRAQLEQAIVNVLGNAVEAAGPDGAISVRVSRAEGRALLEIEDSGPGLTDEARAHLFTPFFSTKARGQGIGLTLVQEILSAHGCDYGLESEPGRPTRFVIGFPRHI